MRTVTLGLLGAAAAVMMAAHVTPRARAQSRPSVVTATSAADLRAWDGAVDRLKRDGRLRVRAASDDPLVPGRAHERLDQYAGGVRVFGGDLVRQTDNGVTVSIFGTMYPDAPVDVAAAMPPENARAIVARLSGAEIGEARAPELLLLPDEAGGARLVYRLKAFGIGRAIDYFIDAATGGVVLELAAAERQTAASLGVGKGVLGDDKKVSVATMSANFVAVDLLRPPSIRTYDMRANVSRTIDFLNGVTGLVASDFALSATTTWSDPVAVDAHKYVGDVYDFYFKRFGRRGLDNRNLALINVIHPVRRDDVFSASADVINSFYVNAFYAGGGVMVYGEGLPPYLTLGGQRWNYLAGALDVIAHELSHGVTEFSSNLIYRNQSGALNEAFSDIMGTAAEFFYQPPGDGPLKAEYLMGEDVITPGGIRSLSNPGQFGDPDHFSKYVTVASDAAHDYGAVHTNMTIVTHAYYLATEGGTNRTSGLSVQGIGAGNRDQIEKVFYRGFTQLMPSNATFSVARAATIQAARDLYGAGSAAERSVTQAWTAVGVR
ncbi:MAG: peptidase M4 family protein [Acidobacteria bacterium]|nr:peptidase M4 family protein [Acidobacteriota bacterium]